MEIRILTSTIIELLLSFRSLNFPLKDNIKKAAKIIYIVNVFTNQFMPHVKYNL